MKHLLAHYANVYGIENVECDDSKLRAYVSGKLHVLVVKDGAGNVKDMSEEMGLEGRHSLSPIPKLSRVWKFDKAGKLAKDEKAEERLKAREEFLKDGRVQSCEELEAQGWKFNKAQEVVEAPAK